MNQTTLHRGFTLIEMLITLAILAIVTSIAIPAYKGYIKTAKMSEAQNNLAILRLAEEEYFLENNTYFEGTDTADLASNSGGLWSASKGSNNNVNFDYVVTSSSITSTWSAKATGNVPGTSIFGEFIDISK